MCGVRGDTLKDTQGTTSLPHDWPSIEVQLYKIQFSSLMSKHNPIGKTHQLFYMHDTWHHCKYNSS